MIVHTKFSIGDRVYPIGRTTEQVARDCTRCGGKGELALAEGGTVPCTKRFDWSERCDSGKVTLGVLMPWAFRSGAVGAVGQVQVKRTAHHHRVGAAAEWDDSNANRYMLTSTGVGSGTVWKEEDLFASSEEAQAECERRNAVMAPEERDNINAGNSRRRMEETFAANTEPVEVEAAS